MEILMSIGELNAFQSKRLKDLKEKYQLTLVDEITNQTDVIFTTRWQNSYLTDHVKALFVPYTGLNRYPLKELKEKGVRVFNTHAKASLVAERAFALSLSVLGKIIPYHNAMLHENRWTTRDHWGSEFWYSLQNKKCGIIGMGHIGVSLKKYLLAFDCLIVNLERDQNKNEADIYCHSVDELIKASDIIYLTCALNDETKHMINLSNINLFEGKVIINVARGEIIEEEALYKGLKDNILIGAGIDVWYNYPDNGIGKPSRYPLDFENLVMSPHASCHAIEYKDSYYDDIFNQLEKYIRSG